MFATRSSQRSLNCKKTKIVELFKLLRGSQVGCLKNIVNIKDNSIQTLTTDEVIYLIENNEYVNFSSLDKSQEKNS